MSPSPARTKPPLSVRITDEPHSRPPEENDHMIIQEVYKSQPGFLTQTQNETQSSILSIIIQKIENLERKETNMTLHTAMSTSMTRLNDRINELTEKQSMMEKVINDLLSKRDKTHEQQATTNNMVSPSLPKSPQTSAPLSFAMITAKTTSMNDTGLPKRPPQVACLNRTQEQNQFKKFHIVIWTKTPSLDTTRLTIATEELNDETFTLDHTHNVFVTQPHLDLTFLQPNCHNRYNTTLRILNSELTHNALLLQESWID
ncbi:hypothetical protein O181_028695 [Austropuccinia psidii MF-1]|uniref:Uncharacterized protein n=1 Tax=Austropuccinia psidii MF-1 TaxID=1389203 RepID=A0A9Q3H4G2_9BASI|nr:hypothetical protein [Austropuccinia psidii MF-1]